MQVPNTTVKHGVQRGERPMAGEVHDVVERSGAFQALDDEAVAVEQGLQDRGYVALRLEIICILCVIYIIIFSHFIPINW